MEMFGKPKRNSPELPSAHIQPGEPDTEWRQLHPVDLHVKLVGCSARLNKKRELATK